jgi:hypothetical protein
MSQRKIHAASQPRLSEQIRQHMVRLDKGMTRKHNYPIGGHLIGRWDEGVKAAASNDHPEAGRRGSGGKLFRQAWPLKAFPSMRCAGLGPQRVKAKTGALVWLICNT